MKKADFDVKLPAFVDRVVYVNNYGARPYCYTIEDADNNADAINRAINYISEKGGGTVVIPEGIWFTAPIEIKSEVEFRIEKNAILKFSKDIDQYPLIITNYEGQECIRAKSPITAENAINIGITGEGIIDGSGELWRPVKQFKTTRRQWEALMEKSRYTIDTKEGGIWMPSESAFKGNEKNIQLNAENALERAKEYYDFYRPVMVSLRHCKSVLLDGVTFMNSPAWNIHPFFCTDLTVRNVKVSNPYYAQNGDGIDVESCNKVHIHNCTFETGDDAICLKSGKNAVARQVEGPCENVYIHDCVVNKGHGGFVIGSEMSRSIRNVLVEDCTFLGTDVGIRMKSALGRGGVVEGITVRNINMTDIKEQAIILTMSYVLNSLNRDEEIKGVDKEDIPYFKNLNFERIHCFGAKEALVIEPLKDMPETISDVHIKASTFVAAKENRIAGDSVINENTVYAMS
ncbi:MAG: glycoside hydrolase family 28 protein [Lachnospira sp.]